MTQRVKRSKYKNPKYCSSKDIKSWLEAAVASLSMLSGHIHSLPPSSLGRGQETIEMCETQLGLYMIMDPDVFSRDQYQRPAIIMPSDKKKVSFFKKFVCHKVRSIEGQDVVRC